MSNVHSYKVKINWHDAKGTENYNNYSRNHTLKAANKKELLCSADPSFLGDANNYNPEELLLASVSACHMLWYLHLCAVDGVVVLDYSDNPNGKMEENGLKGGRFTSITLFPIVTVKTEDMIVHAIKLHQKANELCFIANSLNIKVEHFAVIKSI